MNVISLLMKVVALIIRAILWLVLFPFLLCYWIIKVHVVRAAFKAQLVNAGMRKDVAGRLAKRYNLSFIDTFQMMRRLKVNVT